MTDAEFHAEIADGPANGQAVWKTTKDNLRIRVGFWRGEGGKKGTAFLLLGRFGYIERFGRVARALEEHGYATLVVDWRSQGLSDRLTANPKTGHMHRFADYQNDVAAMLEVAEEQKLPKPYHLIGISMGAAIGLRALIEGLPVASVAFISPMWGIKMSPLQRVAAWPLSWAAQTFGVGHLYVPGESSEIYVQSTPFEENNLTHDPDMYLYFNQQAERVPELQIGGPSMSWLYQSLSECRRLSKMPSPAVPCITFTAGNDDLVHNPSIDERMKQWPTGKHRVVENGKHDLLSEVPEIRASVTAEICDLFDSTRGS